MQATAIIQWTTLGLAAAAVVVASLSLWLNAATNARIDRLPKPAWMGQWPPAPGSIVSSAYDYSHLSFDWLRPGEAIRVGAEWRSMRSANADSLRAALADKAGQGVSEGARQDQQHLHESALHAAAPAPLVQVVLPINEGYGSLRSQSNAVNGHGQASTDSHACVGKESGLEQFGARSALGASLLQVPKLRQTMALSHLQDAYVQRQIDRPVATDTHRACPVCGDQQRSGESDNSTGFGTPLPGLDSATGHPAGVAASVTDCHPSAP